MTQLAQGERLRDLRLSRGWTQEELGRRAGVSRETINRAENGTSPQPLKQQAIADALGENRRDLFPDQSREAVAG